MKNVVLFILVAYSWVLPAQSQSDALENMTGLEQNGNLFFEVNGYVINVIKSNARFNDKEINKVLKRYDVKKPLKWYSDININRENVIVEDELKDKTYPSVMLFQKFYFFPINEKQMQHICFQNTNSRDTVIESAFIRAFNDNLLDKYITYREYSTQSINFIGREIKLGAICNWMFVNNLQCSGNGQMNWSVFSTMEEALKNTELQQLSNSSRKVLKSENINILFEGTPVTATRIVYKFNIPRFVMGGSNLLAVYYVTSEVRGKYVSCVLSNYVNNENDYSLGALLQEVMSLDEKE